MPVQTLASVQAKPTKPEKPEPKPAAKAEKPQEPGRDFYADYESGDITAGFVASHGTWQKWVSNIQTPDGRRGIHETKLVPCTCELCKDAIKKKGWTF